MFALLYHNRFALQLATTLVVLTSTTATRLHAQDCTGQWIGGAGYPGITDPPKALIAWDPDGSGPRRELLVAAGWFGRYGDYWMNTLAAWDGDRWCLLGGKLRKGINAFARLPNGDLVAAGTSGQGPARVLLGNVIRYGGESWVSMGSDLPNDIYALAVLPNGDLIAGGASKLATGQTVDPIARWDGEHWLPFGNGMNGTVYALAILPNGDLIAGGAFTTAGGVSANYIARWDGGQWSPLSSGMNNVVRALGVLSDGTLLAGGNFTLAGGSTRNRLARWNGAIWSSFGEANNQVDSICVLQGGAVAVGGLFDQISGVAARSIALWDGAAWHAMGEGSYSEVRAIAQMSNGRIALSGGRATDFGSSRSGVETWSGVEWEPCSADIGGRIETVKVLSNGHILVGGQFSYAGTQPADCVAKWDGRTWTTMVGSGAVNFSYVYDLLPLPSGDILAAGTRYPSLNPVIARWNGADWTGMGSQSGVQVRALCLLPNGDVYAAGGVPNGLARWNGSSWIPIPGWPSTNGSAYALAAASTGELLVGGAFSTPASRVARWNGTTWSSLGTGVDGTVNALCVLPNGSIAAAGAFLNAGGASANRVAVWDGTSWFPLGSGLDQEANSIAALPNGDVVVGGWFDNAGGLPAQSVARWNGTSWSALGEGFHAIQDEYVRDVAYNNYTHEIIAAGSFDWTGTAAVWMLNRWSDNHVPWVATHPEPQRTRQSAVCALISAPADGYEGCEFRWLRNGEPVHDGPGGASPLGGTVEQSSGLISWLAEGSTAVLQIRDLQFSDAGDYTCIFTNPCGSVTSNPASVTVLCFADYNANTFVNGEDFDEFLPDFEAGDLAADVNHDGWVNGIDFDLFAEHFEAGC